MSMTAPSGHHQMPYHQIPTLIFTLVGDGLGKWVSNGGYCRQDVYGNLISHRGIDIPVKYLFSRHL